jgi:hypothetical protein
MMRPNAVGWGLVGFFFLGGLAFIAVPETRGIWIGQIWVAVSLFLAVLYTVMIRRANKADALRRTGVPGKAIIREMTQTGTYVNQQPLVKLKLDVQPDGLPQFEVEKRMVVPLVAMGQLGVGNALPIHVDANDRDEFVIDWGAPAMTPAGPGVQPDQSGRLRELKEMLDDGTITRREHDEKKRELLKEL